jgi:hypothetical protein
MHCGALESRGEAIEDIRGPQSRHEVLCKLEAQIILTR